MIKRKFYAGEIVAENQPDDMRFVVAFRNKNARDCWVASYVRQTPEGRIARAAAISARHPEAKAARRKVANFRTLGKQYGSRKIRYLPEAHAQMFKIPGAAWFMN